LREMAGSENMLSIIFRVEPQNRADQPVYFVQRVRVPAIEENAKGDAYLQGGFDLGEGQYHVDWLMRARSERVCSSFWDSEATVAAKDRPMTPAIQGGSIEPANTEQFKAEPPVERV